MKNGENYNKKYTNEITIIYDFNKSREFAIEDEFYDERTKELGDTISKEKLFGEIFVNNNKNICKIIINNEKKDLCSYLDNYKNYINENKLEIKLIGVENIIDASYMFSGCVSLASLPDISKWNTIKINSLKEIFFYCVSLTYIDDISKWNIENITDMSGLFAGCSNLSSLPDISKWNTKNVEDIHCIFQKCSSFKILPDISKWNIEKIIAFLENVLP